MNGHEDRPRFEARIALETHAGVAADPALSDAERYRAIVCNLP